MLKITPVLLFFGAISSQGLFAQNNPRVGSTVIELPEDTFRIEPAERYFPGCDFVAKEVKRACSEKKLTEFVAANLSYPSYAKRKRVQGEVVARFVVHKDGSVADIEIIKDIGHGCGAEVMRVLKMMPYWEPGRARGRLVNACIQISICFKLKNGQLVPPTDLRLTSELFPPSAPSSIDPELRTRYVEKYPLLSDCGKEHYGTGDCLEEQWRQYVRDHLRYPGKARRKGIEGTVYVQFAIEKDGTVSSPRLLCSLESACDREALRLVQAMPKWQPALECNSPVRCLCRLPVKFDLME